MAKACKAAPGRTQVLVIAREAVRRWLYNMRPMDPRVLSPLDRLLELADAGLRGSFARPASSRPTPGIPTSLPVDPGRRRHAAGLMRVNHSGEIAAQGLYHGQALTARSAATRAALQRAAGEGGDHLAWCRDRLDGLGSRPSLLNPLGDGGAGGTGALAGLFGDRASLGFMAETERQVEGHLADHLDRLPADDERSRTIVREMQADEISHGRAALAAGGAALPEPIPRLMRLTARVLPGTAYWI